MLKLQAELNQARNMLSIARELIENLISEMRDPSLFETAHVRSLHESVEKTSGDMLFSASRPDGRQHILLGDFTGHGLTAAIAAPLVSDIFYSMAARGRLLFEIAQETDRQLRRKSPNDMFLVAIFIELSPFRQELWVCHCGMKPVLVFRWESWPRPPSQLRVFRLDYVIGLSRILMVWLKLRTRRVKRSGTIV